MQTHTTNFILFIRVSVLDISKLTPFWFVFKYVLWFPVNKENRMLCLTTRSLTGAQRAVTWRQGRFIRDRRCFFTSVPECRFVPKTRKMGPPSSPSSSFSSHYRCFTVSSSQWSSASSPTADQKTPSYSYVIIGAGSAGCVLANRLTEDAQESALLLEAGPKDRWLGSLRLSWKIHMPAALIYNLCDDKYFDWSVLLFESLNVFVQIYKNRDICLTVWHLILHAKGFLN